MKRRLNLYESQFTGYDSGRKDEAESILDFIDSLPEEPASEDFESVLNAADKEYNEEYSEGEYCHEQSFKWGFQEGYYYRNKFKIQEESSEDLKEAASKYVREDFHERSRADFKAGAEWQKQAMKDALQTEYEKGRFDMREEMMKDAIESIVEDWCSDSPEITIPLNPQDFKTDDKVKIVICKTEQQ